MPNVSRVEWTQGLFLRPEHFQQQERFLEHQRRRQTRLLHPHGWGVASIGFDAAARQCVALTRVSGILADGTVFDSDAEPCLPPSLPLTSPSTENQVVYLVLAHAPDDGPATGRASDSGAGRRYTARDVTLVDVSSTHGVEAPRPPDERIAVAVPNLRLTVDERGLEDHEHVAIARVLSLDADGAPVFDEGFAPTCVAIGAGGLLVRELGRVIAALDDTAAALRAFMHDPAAGADAGSLPATSLAHPALPLAVLLARHGQTLRTLASGEAHPQRLHACCSVLAAELGGLDAREPPAMPDYDHVRPAAWMQSLAGTTIAALEGLRERIGELNATPAVTPAPAKSAPVEREPQPARRGIEVPLR